MDNLSSERRSENMRRIRYKDMKPELNVRRLIFSMGFRYRLHRKDLPGKPDLVFSGRRKVIFVHGCFWHQHNVSSCKITRIPKSHKDYWIEKLEGNKKRDRKNQAKLRNMGWNYLIIWECELINKEKIKNKIRSFLEKETRKCDP